MLRIYDVMSASKPTYLHDWQTANVDHKPLLLMIYYRYWHLSKPIMFLIENHDFTLFGITLWCDLSTVYHVYAWYDNHHMLLYLESCCWSWNVVTIIKCSGNCLVITASIVIESWNINDFLCIKCQLKCKPLKTNKLTNKNNWNILAFKCWFRISEYSQMEL